MSDREMDKDTLVRRSDTLELVEENNSNKKLCSREHDDFVSFSVSSSEAVVTCETIQDQPSSNSNINSQMADKPSINEDDRSQHGVRRVHDTVRLATLQFLLRCFLDHDSTSIQDDSVTLPRQLLNSRLGMIADLILGLTPSTTSRRSISSDYPKNYSYMIDYLFAIDGLRHDLSYTRRSYDPQMYSDNLKYSLIPSSRQQQKKVPKSVRKAALKAHAKAVQLMYPILLKPVEIFSALLKFYSGYKSMADDEDCPPNLVPVGPFCSLKNKYYVTKAQNVYFEAMGGDIDLMQKVAYALDLDLITLSDGGSSRNITKEWYDVEGSYCRKDDCIACFPDTNSSVYGGENVFCGIPLSHDLCDSDYPSSTSDESDEEQSVVVDVECCSTDEEEN